MKLGLHIPDFTRDGGAPELRFKLPLRVSQPGQPDLFAEEVIPAVEKS